MATQPELNPRDVLNAMDRALLYVSKRQRSVAEKVQINFDSEFPMVGVRDGEDLKYILQTLANRKLLYVRGEIGNRSNQFFRLNPEGWEKVDQLRRTQRDSSQAFVALWFTDEMRLAWEEGFRRQSQRQGFCLSGSISWSTTIG